MKCTAWLKVLNYCTFKKFQHYQCLVQMIRAALGIVKESTPLIELIKKGRSFEIWQLLNNVLSQSFKTIILSH